MTEVPDKRRVLVLEDDPHACELLAYSLAEAGYNVLTAANGQEGLQKLEDQVVDVIVCDIMMPVMDGFAFRDAVLEDPVLREIAFVFLTARTMPEDQVRGLRTGVDEYITKPYDPEVLIARIESVLTRRDSFTQVARLDTMTQVLNRRTLENEIARELERVRRYKSVGSLAFLDVDNFKVINDTCGHAAGDTVLQNLADIMKENIRTVDMVGRYGGEEFVIFFPETAEVGVRFVLERMQSQFRQRTKNSVGKELTFSAGIAQAPKDAKDFLSLCARADAAMYQAKRQGKARIIDWTPAMGDSPSPA